MPVNMPTHGHGQGYSDLNFLIPELVSGVQFSKGPYFAEQGDFATAGAANINYANSARPADRPRRRRRRRASARALAAASPAVGDGHAARRVRGAAQRRAVGAARRLPQGQRRACATAGATRVNGFSRHRHGLPRHVELDRPDPARARSTTGLIGRFGTLDPTDGGDSYRYSGSFEWQRTRGNASTQGHAPTASATTSNLFSNFTYFLDDPEQRRSVRAGRSPLRHAARKVSHRRLGAVGRPRRAEHVRRAAAQRRHRATSACITRERAQRARDGARGRASLQTSVGGVRAERDRSGRRGCARSPASASTATASTSTPASPPNAGTDARRARQPEGRRRRSARGSGTELYVNAGLGFHSNDARGATITRRSGDRRAGRSRDAARARQGRRGRPAHASRMPQPADAAVALWTLSLDSELLFVGDAGTTEAGRPSHRYGVEWANYYTPRPWLTLRRRPVAVARALHRRRSGRRPHPRRGRDGRRRPASRVDSVHERLRQRALRYFGPRPLIEDDSVRSTATSLVNLRGRATSSAERLRLAARRLQPASTPTDSDIDYFYTSRLPGEPAERRRRHPLPSDAAAHGAREPDRRLLRPRRAGESATRLDAIRADLSNG